MGFTLSVWFAVGIELMAGIRLTVGTEGEMLVGEGIGEIDIGEEGAVANLLSRGGLLYGLYCMLVVLLWTGGLLWSAREFQ
jgi:hypothetical protein